MQEPGATRLIANYFIECIKRCCAHRVRRSSAVHVVHVVPIDPGSPRGLSRDRDADFATDASVSSRATVIVSCVTRHRGSSNSSSREATPARRRRRCSTITSLHVSHELCKISLRRFSCLHVSIGNKEANCDAWMKYCH